MSVVLTTWAGKWYMYGEAANSTVNKDMKEDFWLCQSVYEYHCLPYHCLKDKLMTLLIPHDAIFSNNLVSFARLLTIDT